MGHKVHPYGFRLGVTRTWTAKWYHDKEYTALLTEDIAVRAPTNGDKGINLTNTPVVFVGYGVKAPERGWDDYKGVDVRGKVIVMLVNDPDFEGGEGNFNGKAMTYYGRWTYKYEEGARQGAAGVLVVHETAPASYGWATVKNSNTNAMFDIVRKAPRAEHPPLEGWIPGCGVSSRPTRSESFRSIAMLPKSGGA